MRVFGYILPFIGFRLIDRDEAARRGMLDALPPSPCGKWQTLEAEWMGHGFTLCARASLDESDGLGS